MPEPITATILGSAITKLLSKAAEVVIDRTFGKALKDRSKRRAMEEAAAQAMEEWLIAVLQGLQALAFDDEEIRTFFGDYQTALPHFLGDEEVAEELLKPFTERGSRAAGRSWACPRCRRTSTPLRWCGPISAGWTRRGS